MGEALSKATPWSAATFRSFPARVQSQLLLEREVHGTVQLSQIELERLLDELGGSPEPRAERPLGDTRAIGQQRLPNEPIAEAALHPPPATQRGHAVQCSHLV